MPSCPPLSFRSAQIKACYSESTEFESQSCRTAMPYPANSFPEIRCSPTDAQNPSEKCVATVPRWARLRRPHRVNVGTWRVAAAVLIALCSNVDARKPWAQVESHDSQVQRPQAEAAVDIEALRQSAIKAIIQGDFQAAIQPARIVLHRTREQFDAEHYRVVDAAVLTGLAEVGATLPADQQSHLADIWKLYGELSSLYSQPYDLANTDLIRRYQQIEAALPDAIDRLSKLHPTGHVLRASIQMKWGVIEYHRGRYDRSARQLSAAKQSLQASHVGLYPASIKIEETLGMIHEKHNQISHAEEHLTRALKQSVQLLGPSHPQSLQTANHLAFVFHRAGKYSAASELLRTNAKRARDRFGAEHVEALKATLIAAATLNEIGQPVRAEHLLRHVLATKPRPESANTALLQATARSHLGSCLRRQGRLDAALSELEAAYRHLNSLLGTEHRATQRALFNWGLTLKQAGQAKSALDVIVQLRDQLPEQQKAALHEFVAEVVAEELELKHQLGLAADGSLYLRLLKQLAEESTDQLGPGNARTLRFQSRIAGFLLENEMPGAQLVLEKAIRDATLSLPHNHPLRFELQRQLGEYYFLQGDDEEAARLLLLASKSFEATRTSRGFVGLDTVSNQGVNRHLPLLAVSLAQQGRFDEAWHWLEAGKARRLWDELNRASINVQPERTAPRMVGAQPMSCVDIQKSLADDAAFISWVDIIWPRSHRRSVWACILRSRGSPQWVQLSPFQDDSASKLQPNDLLAGITKPPSESRRATDLRTFRKSWLQPLEPSLSEKFDLPAAKHLIVLFPTPLGLPVELLAPDRTISYAPSATVYAYLKTKHTHRRIADSKLLAVGDPRYLTNAADNRTLPNSADARLRRQLDSLPGTAAEMECLTTLLGQQATLLSGPDANELEVQRLAESGKLAGFRWIHFATHGDANFQQPFQSALLLSDASRSVPLDEALGSGPIHDGRLTAQQIMSTWRIEADLVTLSACQTAMGPRVIGEHYLGFAQALTHAGANSVILSLWPVRDDATALLMNRFYQNLTGRRKGLAEPMPKSDALHEAKQWLRELTHNQLDRLSVNASTRLRSSIRKRFVALPSTNHQRPFQDPYFWAPFILIGNSD